jgi:hypothetical protein
MLYPQAKLGSLRTAALKEDGIRPAGEVREVWRKRLKKLGGARGEVAVEEQVLGGAPSNVFLT